MNTNPRAGGFQTPSECAEISSASATEAAVGNDVQSPFLASRRDLLAMVGPLAAAGAALPHALSAAAPGANVADRSSSIRITKLTATPMQRKVYLKIETNHGVTGWGEIDQLEPYVAVRLAQSLFELLDGENPTRIEFQIGRAHV